MAAGFTTVNYCSQFLGKTLPCQPWTYRAEISLTTLTCPRLKARSILSIEALSSEVSESSNNAANSPYRSASVIWLELVTWANKSETAPGMRRTGCCLKQGRLEICLKSFVKIKYIYSKPSEKVHEKCLEKLYNLGKILYKTFSWARILRTS